MNNKFIPKMNISATIGKNCPIFTSYNGDIKSFVIHGYTNVNITHKNTDTVKFISNEKITANNELSSEPVHFYTK